MTRASTTLALGLVLFAPLGGCQQAPNRSPAARQLPADLLASPSPTSQPTAGFGPDATVTSSGRHLLTLSGVIAGGNGIVYVIDEDRDVLSAMIYQTQFKRIVHMDPIDLSRVLGTMSAATAHYDISGDGRSVRGQKYIAILCPVAQGDDALFLINRAGMVVIFSYDPTSQHLELRAGDSMADLLKPTGG